MKIITDRQYSDLVEEIIKEKKKQAEKMGQSFNGIDSDELQRDITGVLGDSWRVTNEAPVKFTRADINAVASSRFFRKTGVTLLMGMFIAVLLPSVIIKYTGIVMNILNTTIYYTIIGAVILVFLWVYSKRQRKIRNELWRQLGREEMGER